MPAHGIVNQHTFKRLDIFLERLAFCGHHGPIIIALCHQERGNGAIASAALQHCPLGHIDQLTHIAGPRSLKQLRRLLRRHAGAVASVFFRKLIGIARKER